MSATIEEREISHAIFRANTFDKIQTQEQWPHFKRRIICLINTARQMLRSVSIKEEADGESSAAERKVELTPFLNGSFYLLLQACTHDTLHHLFDNVTDGDFSAAWKRFIEHFEPATQVSLSSLMDQLLGARMEFNETFAQYASRLEDLARRINAIEADMVKDRYLWFIIKRGLPESFKPIVDILDQDDRITLQTGKAKLKDFESREKLKLKLPTALLAHGRDKETCRQFLRGHCRFGAKCKYNHHAGVPMSVSDFKSGTGAALLICDFCNKSGHTQDVCRHYIKAKEEFAQSIKAERDQDTNPKQRKERAW